MRLGDPCQPGEEPAVLAEPEVLWPPAAVAVQPGVRLRLAWAAQPTVSTDARWRPGALRPCAESKATMRTATAPISSPTDHCRIPRSFSTASRSAPLLLTTAARCRPSTTLPEVHLGRRRMRLGRVAGRPCLVDGLLGPDETQEGDQPGADRPPRRVLGSGAPSQNGWRRPDRSRRWTPPARPTLFRPPYRVPTRAVPALGSGVGSVEPPAVTS
jgi:hypothetical protein